MTSGFRRGVALLAVKAFLAIGLPILIGLAGFELHGFPADAADWQSWFRGDRGVSDVGHELISWRELQTAHKGPTPKGTAAEGYVKQLLSQSNTRDTP